MATADPFIGFLIDKLFTYLDQNYISRYFGFEDEFRKMKAGLLYQKSVLVEIQKPENQKLHKDETIKATVASLRELIYEADDILVDCQIYADYQNEPKKLTDRIQNKISPNPAKKRLEEMNGKISEMESVFKAYYLSSLIQKTNVQERNNNCATSSRWTTSFSNQFEIVGLTENVKLIKDWIFNSESQRVAILGMGGLGKTTLAQKVFNDKQVCDQFQKRIWVSVSQPADVVKIMRTILDELNIKHHAADSIPATLLQKIKEALRGKTYLIIMDDVWSADGWWSQILPGLTQDALQKNLPKAGTSKSCIMITTRNEEVAINMGVRKLRIHRPNLLDEEHSWSLLCKVAFAASNGICRIPQLEDVGKKITKKCNGLPLAIKAIGGLLSTKPLLSEWQKIHEDFSHKLAEISDASNSVTASLQLSYNDLPSHLKQCVLCCSIYPEDFIISTDQLVYWWAGEGFIVPGDNIKTTKQLAYDCLYELFSRCLIEPVEEKSRYNDRFSKCRMHDMVRESIITVAKQESFSSFAKDNEQVFDNDTRHLGFTGKLDSIQSTDIANSKIRAMVLVWTNKGLTTKLKKDTSLPKVDTLRVLDLNLYHCSDVKQTKEFVEWVKSQKRLTYLNLEDAELKGEPKQFFKDLRNLQYLKIPFKYLDSVSSLRKLRLLEFSGDFHNNERHPEGLANLINLEELSGIILGSPSNRGGPGGNKLGELISLQKFRVLRVIIGINVQDLDVVRYEMSVLSQLSNLLVLTIKFMQYNHDSNMQALEELNQLVPPRSLQELHIILYKKGNIPAFIRPELLPELKHLSIEGNEDLEHLSPNFWGDHKKWNLETLSLINFPNLNLKWETVKQMMPLISYVEIKNMAKFKSFPGKKLQQKFSIWRKIDEEDAITRGNPSSRKRKGKDQLP